MEQECKVNKKDQNNLLQRARKWVKTTRNTEKAFTVYRYGRGESSDISNLYFPRLEGKGQGKEIQNPQWGIPLKSQLVTGRNQVKRRKLNAVNTISYFLQLIGLGSWNYTFVSPHHSS